MRAKLKIQTILLLVFCCCGSPQGRAFTITDVRFSWSVDGKNNPTDIMATSSTVKSLPIYATFTIVGGQADLDALDEDGELSVIIDWKVNGKVVKSPQVGIIPTDWMRDRTALKAQFQEMSFFTWRTFGFISKPLDKRVSLNVRDKDGDLVAPTNTYRGIYEPVINLNL